jgi:hypothetical protein
MEEAGLSMTRETFAGGEDAEAGVSLFFIPIQRSVAYEKNSGT